MLRRLAVLVACTAVPSAAAQTLPPVVPAPAPAPIRTFVISGHGWGHGVGMSQYGALGYARAGVTYDKILLHFYPGTQLGPATVKRLRVLVGEKVPHATIASPADFSVRDGAGTTYPLQAGSYAFGPGLRLKVDPAKPLKQLVGPLLFLPGKAPLEALGRPYRGRISVLPVSGNALDVVNDVPLEGYVRGVVSDEMPQDWPVEAVKAQAVAARSYALAVRRGGEFDVYADTRDQVYGGYASETPVGDAASAGTRGQVLLYDGRVATTYYYSTSGGRTADARDVFSGGKPIPYLVSVDDPYDDLSPYHVWGPVALTAAAVSKDLDVAGVTDLRPVPPTGRASQVVVVGASGQLTLPAASVRRSLELRSTWLEVGILELAKPAAVVSPGTAAELTGAVQRLADVRLESRVGSGAWLPGPAVVPRPDGTFSIPVTAQVTTQYRLAAGDAKSSAVRLVVAA
jgi:stage II sporulation protein D